MKTIYLLEIKQFRTKKYVGVVKARDLVKLATKAELRVTQEAQRPLVESKLKSIARYILEKKGTLSSSIVIGTKDDRLSVKSANNKNLFYMEFPENDKEFEEFSEAFDIMDGQHRLFSFLDEYIGDFDKEEYDISFEMYIKPSLRERRLVFKNTNENQDKVPSNLLMWFRVKLDLMTRKEHIYYPVVNLLNAKILSPLFGRIIMSAEKITGGLKAQQIITILDKSDIMHITRNGELDTEKMFNLLAVYLKGWEEAVGSKIADRDKSLGSFSKISGFRFMILMLPAFYEQAIREHSNFTSEYITDKLKQLFESQGLKVRDIFDKNSEYIKNMGINPFSGESPTTQLAKEWSRILTSTGLDKFDPLVNL